MVNTTYFMPASRAAWAQRPAAARGGLRYLALGGEAAVVATIMNLRAEGLTTRQIAAELDSRGVPSRSGGKWSHAVVARVLTRNKREEFEV